jgi:hypothetical protein
MAKTETATVASIMVNGKTIKLRAKDSFAFAWQVTQAAERAVESAWVSLTGIGRAEEVDPS